MKSLIRLKNAFVAAVNRLDKSFNPSDTLSKLKSHTFTLADSLYLVHILLASFWLFLLPLSIPFKLVIIIAFATSLLIPFTSQFTFRAIPVFAYLLAFFSSRFIPPDYRPTISVVLLPTLESVLYGANISDILTRYTHPILDIIAWVPYGVLHYSFPFILAFLLWLFRPKEALHLWAKTLGYLSLTGVLTQILIPTAAPWYELVYGLTPATYATYGSPGGLIRIDTLLHSNGYTNAFTNSPLVFGAFPSLHSADATLEALFLSHFFPQTTVYAWGYAGILYWSTMYLTHHYLVDVVGGACMATAFFYWMLPAELKDPRAATAGPGSSARYLADFGRGGSGLGRVGASQRAKYAQYDLEAPSPSSASRLEDDDDDFAYDSEDEVNSATPVRKPGQGRRVEGRRGGHRHTASIARLIRPSGEEAR